MNHEILHAGFDGLRFTVQVDISEYFRAILVEAKERAIKYSSATSLKSDDIEFAVRRTGGTAFSVSTGDYGAEWYFLDPENKPANNPGITVDFRAFLLATEGLDGAELHFRECMEAFDIEYKPKDLRVSRVDFAVDFLAPRFEPTRQALVVPPGTRVAEISGIDETETRATGARVTGLRAGAVANRQLAIYDKRMEVITQRKFGWIPIWRDARKRNGKAPLDLENRDESSIWRFELRLGSKQLRGRWEMASWDDLRLRVGDAFQEFCQKIRYCEPQADTNRSRWPIHPLWAQVSDTVSGNLAGYSSGVDASLIREVNRTEHVAMLDRNIIGNAISRAAASGITAEEFESYFGRLFSLLLNEISRHRLPLETRLAIAAERKRFK